MNAYDLRWVGMNGIGRYASEIASRISYQIQIRSTNNPAGIFSALELGARLKKSGAKSLYTPGYIPPIGSHVPYVFTIHDLNHLDVPYNTSRAKKIYYKNIIFPGVHKAHRIVTVSEFVKKRIIQWSGCDSDKVVVACNGVSHVFQDTINPANTGYHYLFCCSNRKGHKNELRLIDAYHKSEVKEQVKIVFTGEANSTLKKRIQTLKLESSIVFCGKVSEKQLAGWYRGAVATVFPSLYEGFGLPVIESMACGTPVITSNTTSLPEVGGDAALYVDPMSVDDIASGIKRVIDDNSLRRRMQERGLHRASLFTWDRASEKVKQAIHGM